MMVIPRKNNHLTMGQRAAKRIKSIAREMGSETGHSWGWIANAARELGLPYSTLWAIVSDNTDAVGTKTIEQVCGHVGCSPSDLMETSKGKKTNGKRHQ